MEQPKASIDLAEDGSEEGPGEKRSLFGRVVDTIFGYDYFISYAWSDGGVYAKQLAAALRNSGFECFLDTERYAAGDDWKRVGRWTLRRTKSLILVGSPKALRSKPVLLEVRLFRRFSNRVVPIDFDGTLRPDRHGSELLGHVPEEIIRLQESKKRLSIGPTESVLHRLRKDFKGLRQAQKRMRLVAGASAVFAILAAIAIWAFFRAEALRQEERRLRLVGSAQTMAAEAINESAQFEGERAALLARQAYIFNKRLDGHIIARADEVLRTVLDSPYFNTSPRSVTGPASSTAFDPSAGRLVVAGVGKVSVLNLRDDDPEWRPLEHPSLRRPAVALSPRGSPLAVVGAEEGVLIYDAWEAGSKPTGLLAAGARTRSAAFSRDGKYLAVGTDQGSVFVWNLDRGDRARRLVGGLSEGRDSWANALAFSPDAALLVAAAHDGPIVLWDLKRGKRRELLRSARSRSSTSLAFSPDGRWLAAASTAPAQVLIWDMDLLDAPSVSHAVPAALALVFTKDASRLVVGDGFGQLYMWRSDELDGPPTIVRAHTGELRALALSRDGRYFVTGCEDGTIRIWELHSNTNVAFRWSKYKDGKVESLEPIQPPLGSEEWLAYSAVGLAAVSRAADGSLYLHLNPASGDSSPVLLSAEATSAAFSPSGAFLAVGDATSVAIWNVLPEVSTEVSSADTVTRVGGIEITVHDQLRVEVRQENEPAGDPANLRDPGQIVEAATLSAGASHLLTVSTKSLQYRVPKILRLRTVPTVALAEEVCRRVRRNLTAKEWESYVGADVPYERTCPQLPSRRSEE